jgi:ribonuclease PH
MPAPTPPRADGRGATELRPFSVDWDPMSFALSSLIVRTGRTAVLCSVSLRRTSPAGAGGTVAAGSALNIDCFPVRHRNGSRES